MFVVWCHVSFSGNRSANCSFCRILSLLPPGSCLGMVHRFMIIFPQIKEFVSNAFMLLLVLATYTLHPMAAPWWLVLLRLGLAITYRLSPTSYQWVINNMLICNCSLVALTDDISPQPHIFDNVDHGSCCMVSLWRPGTILWFEHWVYISLTHVLSFPLCGLRKSEVGQCIVFQQHLSGWWRWGGKWFLSNALKNLWMSFRKTKADVLVI